MRRASKSRSSYNLPTQRDILTPIARSPLLRQQLLIHKLIQQLARPHVEPPIDRRRYNPRAFAHPETLTQSSARLNNRRLRKIYASPFEISVPHKVGICIRRKSRREVLHALKRTGKGAGRKLRRYTYYSDFHC